MAIIWGIYITFQLPILAITLKEHGGVRGEARFPPFNKYFCNNVAMKRGIYITSQLPIISYIGNSLNEHGGVTNRLRFVSVRGEARFPPNAAIIRGILFPIQFPNIFQLLNYFYLL